MHVENINAHRRYVPVLVTLFGLFLFRVCAQLLQAVSPVSFLPTFSAWHSGTLAYHWLVVSQLLILLLFGLTIRSFLLGSCVPRRRRGRWLIGFGGVYFAVMLFRLIAGATFAAGDPWFGAKIPAFFHLVLASFLLVVGHFHLKYGNAQRT